MVAEAIFLLANQTMNAKVNKAVKSSLKILIGIFIISVLAYNLYLVVIEKTSFKPTTPEQKEVLRIATDFCDRINIRLRGKREFYPTEDGRGYMVSWKIGSHPLSFICVNLEEKEVTWYADLQSIKWKSVLYYLKVHHYFCQFRQGGLPPSFLSKEQVIKKAEEYLVLIGQPMNYLGRAQWMGTSPATFGSDVLWPIEVKSNKSVKKGYIFMTIFWNGSLHKYYKNTNESRFDINKKDQL
jgi:hypothetical protein